MRYCYILILSLLAFNANSQDKIYKKGGNVILARIQEIGIDEIKYKVFNEADGPLYAIEKDRIIKIVYQNGRTESYNTSSLKDPELYIGQSKHALKLNFLSPLLGYTQFGYERSLKPGRSIEFSLGLIGLGKNQVIDENYYYPGAPVQEIRRGQAGASIGVGYKFIRTPDFINRNIRFAHLLQGTYIKPTLYTGVYGENIIDYKTQVPLEERRTVVYGSLMVELGKQWIFGDQFIFDIYFGLGYCFDNINDDDNYSYSSISTESEAHHFNVIRLGSSPGFALSGGLKIGMLLGKPKE
jgi:hypothetical protein